MLSLALDGHQVLTAQDDTFAYGMAGLRMGSAGRMTIASLSIDDLA
jgi:hypothetical protein